MGIAGAVASSVMGAYSQNRSIEQQAQAQVATAKSMMQSMNYSFQNMEQERSSAFEAAVDDLTQVRLQALRQQSSVDAAVSEGLMGGGRTAALISRSVANDTARTAQSVKTNYSKQSNEIDLNKETALLQTKQQIASIPKLEKPNILSTALGIAGDYYNAKNVQEEIDLRGKMANTQGNITPQYMPDYDWNPMLNGKDIFSASNYFKPKVNKKNSLGIDYNFYPNL